MLHGVVLEEGLDLEKVVRRFDLTPGAIKRAVSVARAACDVGAVTEEDLMAAALLQEPLFKLRHRRGIVVSEEWGRWNVRE